MLKKFFWMCSGADTDLLQKCSKSEQVKYAGIGEENKIYAYKKQKAEELMQLQSDAFYQNQKSVL